MDAEQYPDPFRDAMQHGLHRAVQIASCAVTAGQVYLYQQKSQARAVAESDEHARRALQEQARVEREAARATWVRGLHSAWLDKTDLIEAAQAWGAAMPYSDKSVPWYEPAAATAMRKCEDRLRELHPYAMARYDRLRADGMSPAEAMREAAPFFARAPFARDAPGIPRLTLSAGNGAPTWTASPPADTSGPAVDEQVLERRGRQILDALQDRAREHGGRPLGESEQRTVLEAITSLPPEIIHRIVKPTATTTAKARTGQTPQTWQHDFPYPIEQVLAAASRPPSTGSAPHSAVQPSRRPDVHRGGRS